MDSSKYLLRCLQLAAKGLGAVAPNPMVGAVVVHNNQIIGEGYHQKFGDPHAEVNAINSVKDLSLLQNSTLYVNLEPCSHTGKTPPCADLILKHKIPKVVIGCLDPNPKVAGQGMAKLKAAGVEVIISKLEKESVEFNHRFFTFHQKKRPYIILKWAQTLDGFIDVDRNKKEKGINWITNEYSKRMVHQWRAEEDAILVGTNTALTDNPDLTVREVSGENPLRISIDRKGKIPATANLKNGLSPTLIFTSTEMPSQNNLEYQKIDFNATIEQQILEVLYSRNISSLIIEGGRQLLNSFLETNLWDEARVFIGDKKFNTGLAAPKIPLRPNEKIEIKNDKLLFYKNLNP